MDRLTEMEAFIRVVDSGGFTEAAKRMGVSKSAISKYVSGLEARLGARLLNRTTRHVSPTEIGQAYCARARQLLEDANAADGMVSAMQDAPRGRLRISAPMSFGPRRVAPVVTEFLAAYPDVSIETFFEDRFVDLMNEGFDLAIRAGALPDSGLIARKLLETPLIMAAAPAYLGRRGTPETLDDLASHELLHYALSPIGAQWKLRDTSGRERSVRFDWRMSVNNGDALARAACDGFGIVQAPGFIICDDLEAGRLVEILPATRADPLPIWALYSSGKFLQPKLRAFIELLSQRLDEVPDCPVC